MLWADYWYAVTTKCITDDLICGRNEKKYNKNLLKVYLLRKAISMGRLDANEEEVMYNRLQCLINLRVQT